MRVKAGTAVGAKVCPGAGFVTALGTVDGARGLDGGVQLEFLVGNVGIVTDDLQLAQALRADDLVVAVDEHLGAQVHLFTAFGTGVYHNDTKIGVANVVKKHVNSIDICKNRAARPCGTVELSRVRLPLVIF